MTVMDDRLLVSSVSLCTFFFVDVPASADIYTLSLHDALPISPPSYASRPGGGPSATSFRNARRFGSPEVFPSLLVRRDRKSTRLNSSHMSISYAVFCLKKKNAMYIDHSTVYVPKRPLICIDAA